MSALNPYIKWLQEEVENKQYGEVILKVCVAAGQIKLVKKESTDTEKVR